MKPPNPGIVVVAVDVRVEDHLDDGAVAVPAEAAAADCVPHAAP
jgi:hypothetical protein